MCRYWMIIRMLHWFISLFDATIHRVIWYVHYIIVVVKDDHQEILIAPSMNEATNSTINFTALNKSHGPV